jgi:phosphate transport system permease protein
MRKLYDIFLKALLWFCGMLVFLLAVSMVIYIFVKGFPMISWELLSTAPSELYGTYGVLPMIINTLYIIVITLLISTPIGIGAAIYLTEYAKVPIGL